jgi:hypothetical protein
LMAWRKARQQLEDHEKTLMDLDKATNFKPKYAYAFKVWGHVKHMLKDYERTLLDLALWKNCVRCN